MFPGEQAQKEAPRELRLRLVLSLTGNPRRAALPHPDELLRVVVGSLSSHRIRIRPAHSIGQKPRARRSCSGSRLTSAGLCL
jgi:hypothetical protein